MDNIICTLEGKKRDELETNILQYLKSNQYFKKQKHSSINIHTPNIIKPIPFDSTSTISGNASSSSSSNIGISGRSSSYNRFSKSVVSSYDNLSKINGRNGNDVSVLKSSNMKTSISVGCEITGRPGGIHIVSNSKRERNENCIDSSARKDKTLETNEADHQTAKKRKGNDINTVTDMKVNDHNPVQIHLEGTKKQLFVESDSDDDNLVVESDSDDDNLVEC
jgi:hypothetical protein